MCAGQYRAIECSIVLWNVLWGHGFAGITVRSPDADEVVLPNGLEPLTYPLQMDCSFSELRQHVDRDEPDPRCPLMTQIT